MGDELWSDERIKEKIWQRSRGHFDESLYEASLVVCQIMRADYEAELAALRTQVAELTAKVETMKEVADIHLTRLTQARELLDANGIYEDWQEDGDDE